MSRYTVVITDKAERQLGTIRDRKLVIALRDRILRLGEEPRPPRVKKLVGRQEQWRVREQDWRIVYVIEDGRLVVLVVSVAKRDEVYR